MIAIAYRLEIMAGRVVSVPTSAKSACRRNEPLPMPQLMLKSVDIRRYQRLPYVEIFRIRVRDSPKFTSRSRSLTTGPSFCKKSYHQQFCHINIMPVPERSSIQQILACTCTEVCMDVSSTIRLHEEFRGVTERPTKDYTPMA
jgi:hypothetical protein